MTEPQNPSRRIFLRGAVATSAVLAAGVGTAPSAAAAPGGFPDYRYVRTLLTPSQLKYNPTGEIIFPCIRGTAGRIAGALGRYYLYYAPHDAPGGICLAYGDSLEGPFTEYPANPLVSRTWQPHYSVSHVSSPHVLWNEDAKEMWLYFHGENTTTRLARSKDGITFTYDKVVLSTSMMPAGSTETSTRGSSHTTCRRGTPATSCSSCSTTPPTIVTSPGAGHRTAGTGPSIRPRSYATRTSARSMSAARIC